MTTENMMNYTEEKVERSTNPFGIVNNKITIKDQKDGQEYNVRLVFTDHGTQRYFERQVGSDVLDTLSRGWECVLKDAENKKSVSYIEDKKNSLAVVCNGYWNLKRNMITLLFITLIKGTNIEISKKQRQRCNAYCIH